MYIYKLSVESLVVGLVMSSVTSILLIISDKYLSIDICKLCKNKKQLFGFFVIIGAITHFIFDKLGLNEKYCIHGSACNA
tara:strand:+ start:57 stop:296 length:240 start_codon:yes stop_codon:yes gene_type:complete